MRSYTLKGKLAIFLLAHLIPISINHIERRFFVGVKATFITLFNAYKGVYSGDSDDKLLISPCSMLVGELENRIMGFGTETLLEILVQYIKKTLSIVFWRLNVCKGFLLTSVDK